MYSNQIIENNLIESSAPSINTFERFESDVMVLPVMKAIPKRVGSCTCFCGNPRHVVPPNTTNSTPPKQPDPQCTCLWYSPAKDQQTANKEHASLLVFTSHSLIVWSASNCIDVDLRDTARVNVLRSWGAFGATSVFQACAAESALLWVSVSWKQCRLGQLPGGDIFWQSSCHALVFYFLHKNGIPLSMILPIIRQTSYRELL